MIPDKIYEIGHMLGLNNKDIYAAIANGPKSGESNVLKKPSSPVDAYPKWSFYGTVSIKDF
jgi:hypothetical protein